MKDEQEPEAEGSKAPAQERPPAVAVEGAAPVTGTTAPRPHRITIILGVMGPLVTVLAVGVASCTLWTSEQSLKLNERSMKVGLRAYMAFLGVGDGARLVDSGAGVAIEYSFAIKNFGSTPASMVDYVVRPLGLPGGWTMRPTGTPASSAGDGTRLMFFREKVAQGGDTTVSNVIGFDPPGASGDGPPGAAAAQVNTVRMLITFGYLDVFGEKQTESRCLYITRGFSLNMPNIAEECPGPPLQWTSS